MMTRNKGAKFAPTSIQIPDAALGAFAVLLGVSVAIAAWGYREGSTYDSLGPSLFPLVIASGLIVTGLVILLGAFASDTSAEPVEQVDWIAVALIVVGLIVPIALIVALGWIPVITIVFALGARAFGSRRTAVDLGLGLLFGILTFAFFNYALGLHLPSGWIISRLFG